MFHSALNIFRNKKLSNAIKIQMSAVYPNFFKLSGENTLNKCCMNFNKCFANSFSKH